MPLTDYRTLGRSSLVVSPLALGTMTFRGGRWGSDEITSLPVFDAYRDAGDDFLGTADIDSGGAFETMLGKFIAETGARDEARRRRQRRSKQGRQRRQERPPRAGGVVATARNGLRRPLLDASQAA